MVRNKVPELPVLNGFKEVSQAIGRIGRIEREVAKVEAEGQKQIDDVKATMAKMTEKILEEKAQLEKNIQEFCVYNQNKFEGKKSLKLDFGTVGFRKSTKLVTLKGWKWATVVQKLQELKLNQFLKEKAPSVDKEAVKNSGRTDEELRTWGVEVKTEDEFYYDVDKTKVADMPQMDVVSQQGKAAG